MNTVKSKIFNYLTGAQKSELCHYISKFVKKHFETGIDEILALFIEEEKYYLEINSSRHPWIIDYIDDQGFYKDLKLYIAENQRKYEYKESQKEFVEKQKQFQKQQRNIAHDKKMELQKPTFKQIKYYKALCRSYNIDVNSIDTQKASKLDLKNAISALLADHQMEDKQKILSKLNEIIELKENN